MIFGKDTFDGAKQEEKEIIGKVTSWEQIWKTVEPSNRKMKTLQNINDFVWSEAVTNHDRNVVAILVNSEIAIRANKIATWIAVGAFLFAGASLGLGIYQTRVQAKAQTRAQQESLIFGKTLVETMEQNTGNSDTGFRLIREDLQTLKQISTDLGAIRLFVKEAKSELQKNSTSK